MLSYDEFKTYVQTELKNYLPKEYAFHQLVETKIHKINRSVDTFRLQPPGPVSSISGDLAYIKAVAGRIRKHMEEQVWEFDDNDLLITVSIGCAIGSGDDNVVMRADDNLYMSKTNGKNQVTM